MYVLTADFIKEQSVSCNSWDSLGNLLMRKKELP